MRASCVICSVKLENGSTVSGAPCGHVFHMQCLKVMLRSLHTCPECKIHVSSSDISCFPFNSKTHNEMDSLAFKNEIEELKADSNIQERELGEIKKGNTCHTQYFAESDSSESEESNFRDEPEIYELLQNSRTLSEKEKAKLLEKRDLLLNDSFQCLNKVKMLVSSIEEDLDDITDICTENVHAVKEIIHYPIFRRQNQNSLNLEDFIPNSLQNENDIRKKISDTCQMNLAKTKLVIEKFRKQINDLNTETETLKERKIENSVDHASPAPSVEVNSPTKSSDMTALNADMKRKKNVKGKKVGKTPSVKSTVTRNKPWLRSEGKAAKNSVKQNTSQ